jgi:cytochrome c553
MHNRATIVTLTLCTLLGVQEAAWAQGDPVAGEREATICTGCHNGVGMRINLPQIYRIPKVAGQNEAYLVSAMKDYRSGARANETMHAMSVSLTDKQIADLATYFAQLPWN